MITLDPIAKLALLRENSVAGVVRHELERMIFSGELPAGTRLNENAVAAKLGVSRGPVREACRSLEELGLVELIPNRGVFIKRMAEADVQEVYDLRAGLTGLAGSLLAALITDGQLAELRALVGEMEEAALDGDFQRYYPANLEFHDFIVRATGNGRLAKTYRALVKEFHLFRAHGLVQGDSLRESNTEHRAILAALEARDTQAAYLTSFQHVANGKRRMLAALATLSDPGPSAPVRGSVEAKIE